MPEDEVLINLDGKAQETLPRVLIKEGEHHGAFISFAPIQGKKYKSEVMEPRIIMQIRVKTGEEIPFYLRPKITKGGKGFSNSNLYNLLDTAGLLEAVKKNQGSMKTIEGLLKFLEANFSGIEGRFGVKTINKGDKEKEYSVVKECYEVFKRG